LKNNMLIGLTGGTASGKTLLLNEEGEGIKMLGVKQEVIKTIQFLPVEKRMSKRLLK